MKRRIATKRLSKIYIARCGYTWLDESKWPQEWQISPISIIYLKIPSEKMNLHLQFNDELSYFQHGSLLTSAFHSPNRLLQNELVFFVAYDTERDHVLTVSLTLGVIYSRIHTKN